MPLVVSSTLMGHPEHRGLSCIALVPAAISAHGCISLTPAGRYTSQVGYQPQYEEEGAYDASGGFANPMMAGGDIYGEEGAYGTMDGAAVVPNFEGAYGEEADYNAYG